MRRGDLTIDDRSLKEDKERPMHTRKKVSVVMIEPYGVPNEKQTRKIRPGNR
jgi:hypothetical protein